MSLGFSLKDFLTVANLISTITSSLKNSGGSTSDYQELVRELNLLQHALSDIEHLTGLPSELPSINAIKCAALNCQYVLDEFARKLQKYEKGLGDGAKESSSMGKALGSSLTDPGQGVKGKRALGKAGEKVKDSLKKVEWEMFMKEDVRDLRAYLTSHVGSLNMRMITQGLSTASIAAKKADDNRTALERKLEELRDGIKVEFKEQQLILRKTNTLLDKVIDLVNDEIAPQLKEHGTCNVQILDIVKSLQTRIPDPEIRFTWFQDPCRLEDARGHRLPIPSEFGYELVRAIIKELFKTGPGHRFVRAGDYQLSNIKNSNHLILGSEKCSLTPGMNIRMAIVLNNLHTSNGRVCPMPHCRSSSFVNAIGGGNTCSNCGVWFAEACKLEKRPHVQEIIDSSEDEPTAKRLRRSMKSSRASRLEEEKNSLELTAIKNIRIPGSDDRITRLSFENKEQNQDKQQPHDQRKEGPQPPLVPTNRAFESKMVHAPDWDGNQYTGTAKDQSIPADVELDYVPSNISSFGGGAENDFLLVETNGESVQSGVAFGDVDLDSDFSKDAINRMFMKYERIIPRQRGVGRYHAHSTQIPAGGTDLKFHEILEEAILEARKLENHPNLSNRFRTSSSSSSYNSTSSPSTSSIPMSIPHSQDPVPPPLPPPRYLVDIVDNENNRPDISWQWGNKLSHESDWSRLVASIQPRSSLYGSFHSRKSVMDERPDNSRGGSSTSTIKSMGRTESRDNTYPQIDEGYASLSGTSIRSSQ